VPVVRVLRDVAIILLPMLILLLVVIVFPEFVLFLPRWLTPKFL
jgi:TRAP-type C4-dicarboxylate transport system permease large subunit